MNQTSVLSRPGRHGRAIWALTAAGAVLLLLLGLPLVVLLWRALQANPLAHLASASAAQALGLSLLTSTLAVVIAIAFGTPLAYALARWSFRRRAWIETLIDLPVVLPPAVAGLALLVAFGRQSLIGQGLAAFGLSVPFTTFAVVLAQSFVAAPLYVRSARIGFASIDPQLEEAAFTEGVDDWQLLTEIMLPLSWRAVLSGIVLCWARALGEFGATLMFAGNLPGRTQTMPIAIYLGLEQNLDVALALSAVLIVASAGVLLLLRRLESSQ
ncbi:MAG: ABC transporter permease [Anaerolineales bacterium]